MARDAGSRGIRNHPSHRRNTLTHPLKRARPNVGVITPSHSMKGSHTRWHDTAIADAAASPPARPPS